MAMGREWFGGERRKFFQKGDRGNTLTPGGVRVGSKNYSPLKTYLKYGKPPGRPAKAANFWYIFEGMLKNL